MKSKLFMRGLFFVLVVTACFFSCKKNNAAAGERIEIFLLKSFQTIPLKCQINPSVSVLEDIAAIQNEDILTYSQTEYSFKLTNAAIQKIKVLNDRTPFAVTVDKEVIYYGFFKPNFSSSSCDHSITMDTDWLSGNKILLKLGYPGQLQGVTIIDNRNDPKLIATLRKQGKLL